MPNPLFLQIQTTAMIVVATANVILAVLIFLRNRKKSTLFFIVSILTVGSWAAGVAFYMRPGLSQASNILFSQWNYTTAGIIAVSFMFFGLFFGNENRKLPKIAIISTIFTAGLFTSGLIFPKTFKLVIENVNEIDGIKVETFGYLYWLYIVYIIGFFSIGFGSLAKKFKKSSGVFRKQLLYIFAGTGISTISGLIANIFLPFLFDTPNLIWLGPIGSFLMILSVFYAITKHGLWDFKIIATELFVSIIVLILLIETTVAKTTASMLLKGGIFGIMSFFSYFLIRGIIKEVESRERIERLAENLSAANKRLLELDVEKSDFVSIASHQLRTPLTVIKGYASMLLEGSFGQLPSGASREAIDKIYQASQRLVLMIEDFLNISRIEKGEMVYNMARVDFKELVKEVIADLSSTIEGEQLKINFESPTGGEFYITGDHLKLRQVVSNIVDNSIKYTPAGGHITVRLSKDEQAGKVIFSVQDTGVGLTKEAMEKLFQKFSRAKGMSKLHTEGRGLGLYVAKQIVEAHGGEVKAFSSGKDQGSTFTVTLPDQKYEKKRQEIRSFIQKT